MTQSKKLSWRRRDPEKMGVVCSSREGQKGRGLGRWARSGWGPGAAPGPNLPGGWTGPGLLLLIALISYTAKNAWKSDVFFSWSYFSAWLAFPLYVIAGNLDSGKRVEENTPGTLLPAETPQPPIQETPL